MKRNIMILLCGFLVLFLAIGVKEVYINANKPPSLVGESKDGIWYATYSLDDDGHDSWTGIIERKKSNEYKLTHLYFLRNGLIAAEATEKDMRYEDEETNDTKQKYAEFVVLGGPPEKDTEYAVKAQWTYKGKEYEETIPLKYR